MNAIFNSTSTKPAGRGFEAAVVCSRSGGAYDFTADAFYLVDLTSSWGQETDDGLNTASGYAAPTLVPGASLDPNPRNTRTSYTEKMTKPSSSD